MINRENINKKHVISLTMENKSGALARVAGLFSGRGYNIQSLTVNETEKEGISNMTIVTFGEDAIVEQIIKHLRKLINVLKVRSIYDLGEFIEREMALIKLHLPPKHRSEVLNICDVFRARVVNMIHESTIIEITGTTEKLMAFIELVRPYGLIEVIKTGTVAMVRGSKSTTEVV